MIELQSHHHLAMSYNVHTHTHARPHKCMDSQSISNVLRATWSPINNMNHLSGRHVYTHTHSHTKTHIHRYCQMSEVDMICIPNSQKACTY